MCIYGRCCPAGLKFIFDLVTLSVLIIRNRSNGNRIIWYSASTVLGGIPTVEISPVEIRASQALKKPDVTQVEEEAQPQVQNSLTPKPVTAGNPDVRIEEVRTEPIPSKVFVVVEEMPSFTGGEKILMEFIYRNIQYLEEAKLYRIEGRVILRFCITSQGYIAIISVIKRGIRHTMRKPEGLLQCFRKGRQAGREESL